ncbi:MULTISPECIES: hypothetical protein [Psychrilyobacter]|uniref:hypothetical protein n=1 Tax=Psychrilyobacter TaxID=623282 RepID=UPI000404C173|nr:hypothetical protein [Psychrilyobacter atlanticus]
MKDFYRKEDLMKILDISENTAYKIIRELNAELKEQGYKTICGRLHRKYFDKRYRNN